VLQPLGLRLSAAKARIVHMADGFDFRGFHIQWKRKRGTNKWYVYTFIAQRPVRAVKAKVRSLTHRVDESSAPAASGISSRLARRNRCATHAARRPPGSITGSDARDLDTAPAQQHSQCACVVGIATQVCVELNTHPARMRRESAGRGRLSPQVSARWQ
jgi:hypothetical protein